MIVDILARSVPYILCAGKNPIWSWKACWRGTPPLSSFFRAPWWMPLIWPGSRYINQSKTNKQTKIRSPVPISKKKNQNQRGDKHRESPALLNFTFTNLFCGCSYIYWLLICIISLYIYFIETSEERALFTLLTLFRATFCCVCIVLRTVPYTCETKGGMGRRLLKAREFAI